MSNKVFIGNLDYKVTEGELSDIFDQCGEISRVQVITDRDTGQSKGFAFITFEDGKSAEKAIDIAKEGTLMLNSRPLRVNLARPRKFDEDGRGGSGGRSGGGGGRNGGGGGGGRHYHGG